MNCQQIQVDAEQSRRRAVALGESGDSSAINELLRLTNHQRPNVRRAAASALGKLSDCARVETAVPHLCALTRDTRPHQVICVAWKKSSSSLFSSLITTPNTSTRRP